ncbi:MAG: cell division protein ZapA [Desulfomonile tiedjei]|nr:cell division protein ZapA [Desulfomonile tiedjei]
MQVTEAVKVRLFGREYNIRGHGNKKYVQRLADFINERADEVQRHTKVVSTIDLVILTLLNITDEMFQYRQVKDQTIKELEEKAEKLLKAIDRTV